ncbi:ribonuclease H-like domain-containing protein [Tanacetum coccineum]
MDPQFTSTLITTKHPILDTVISGEATFSHQGAREGTVAVTMQKYQKRRMMSKAKLLAARPSLMNNSLRYSKQYGNFKAEGSETLEQTFNRLQAIVSHLEFIDVPVDTRRSEPKSKRREDQVLKIWPSFLLQIPTMEKVKFLRLKVFPLLVVKLPLLALKLLLLPLAMIIYNVHHISTISKVISIRYEDITQIDDDDIKEMDIKWNMALLSIRADRIWKKITFQGSDVAGFDKSKVECFNCHKLGHFAKECRVPRS